MRETISLCNKYCLSIDEAAMYFGIGQKKLRWIVDQNPDADFVLHNGCNIKIKRKLFESFIDNTCSI